MCRVQFAQVRAVADAVGGLIAVSYTHLALGRISRRREQLFFHHRYGDVDARNFCFKGFDRFLIVVKRRIADGCNADMPVDACLLYTSFAA